MNFPRGALRPTRIGRFWGLHSLETPSGNSPTPSSRWNILFNPRVLQPKPFSKMLALKPGPLRFLFVGIRPRSFCHVPIPPTIWKSIEFAGLCPRWVGPQLVPLGLSPSELFHCGTLTSSLAVSDIAFSVLDTPGRVQI